MITKKFFGTTSDGRNVDSYELKNSSGTVATIITYGARLSSWIFNGVNVVLGYDNIEGYEKDTAYKGAIVGRCANRIGGAQFELNGLPVIINEMKKTADQSGDNSVIFKDTKKNADKRAKDAFAAGIAKLREGGIGSYAGLVVVLKGMDNDTNQWKVIDKVTL